MTSVEEQLALANMTDAYRVDMRRYALLRDLGHEWAGPVYDSIKALRDDYMRQLRERLSA